MKALKAHVFVLVCLLATFTSCQNSHEAQLEEVKASTTVAAKNSATVNQLIAQVRQATVQYHDHTVAEGDGYVNTGFCVSNPFGEGAMGYHFVNFSRMDEHHDPLEPEVLVYEMKGNGDFKLVAVEYLHVSAPNVPQPMFAGEVAFHPFPEPFADYALHVWAWRGNPDGIFADFNVNVECL